MNKVAKKKSFQQDYDELRDKNIIPQLDLEQAINKLILLLEKSDSKEIPGTYLLVGNRSTHFLSFVIMDLNIEVCFSRNDEGYQLVRLLTSKIS